MKKSRKTTPRNLIRVKVKATRNAPMRPAIAPEAPTIGTVEGNTFQKFTRGTQPDYQCPPWKP